MEAADHNSNKSATGGVSRFWELVREARELAPAEKRARIDDAARGFVSNKPGIHGMHFDAAISEFQGESEHCEAAPSTPNNGGSAQARDGRPGSPAHAPPHNEQRSKNSAPHCEAQPAAHMSDSSTAGGQVLALKNVPRPSLQRGQGLDRFFMLQRKSDPDSASTAGGSASSAAPAPPPASRPPPPAEGAEAAAAAEAAANAPSEQSDPAGHYGILHLSCTATSAQVRAAYLRRVLAVHPDKGGSKQDFRRVVLAFEVLFDKEKRSEYDRSCGQQTASDTTSSSGTSGGSAAKVACAELLTAPPDVWSNLLEWLPLEVLQEAHKEVMQMAGSRRRGPKRGKHHVPEDGGDDGEASGGTVGLTRLPNGEWSVNISWRNFRVGSSLPIPTLRQASRLHSSLVHMRSIAKARHRALLKDAAESDCGGVVAGDLDDCPPLLQSELQAVLREEPALLHFASDLTRKECRLMSPWTPDLAQSFHFRALIRRVLAQEDATTRALAKKKATRVMQAKAATARVERQKFLQDLQAAFVHELSKKRHAAPAKSTEAVPAEQPLALQETAAAATAQELAVLRQELATKEGVLATVSSAAQRDAEELSRLRELVHQEHVTRLSAEIQLEARKADAKRCEEERLRAERVQQEAKEARERSERQMSRLTELALRKDQELETAQRQLEEQKRAHALTTPHGPQPKRMPDDDDSRLATWTRDSIAAARREIHDGSARSRAWSAAKELLGQARPMGEPRTIPLEPNALFGNTLRAFSARRS